MTTREYICPYCGHDNGIEYGISGGTVEIGCPNCQGTWAEPLYGAHISAVAERLSENNNRKDRPKNVVPPKGDCPFCNSERTVSIYRRGDNEEDRWCQACNRVWTSGFPVASKKEDIHSQQKSAHEKLIEKADTAPGWVNAAPKKT